VVRGDLSPALCEEAERAEHLGIAQQFLAARRVVPNDRQAERMIAGGVARFFAAGLPMNKAVSLGMDGPVGDDAVERLTAFYRERDAPARTVASEMADASLGERLQANGYRAVQPQHVLIGDLREMYGALDPRVRVAADLVAWGSAAEEIRNGPFEAFAAVTGELMGTGAGIVPLELIVDGRIAAVCGMGRFGEMGTLFFGHTLPWARNQGLQSTLIRHRVKLLQDSGARYVRASILPDCTSERNAQRAGMQIAYDRTMWELP
jgi:hypothetical protein